MQYFLGSKYIYIYNCIKTIYISGGLAVWVGLSFRNPISTLLISGLAIRQFSGLAAQRVGLNWVVSGLGWSGFAD